jgi:hypothetical protein
LVFAIAIVGMLTLPVRLSRAAGLAAALVAIPLPLAALSAGLVGLERAKPLPLMCAGAALLGSLLVVVVTRDLFKVVLPRGKGALTSVFATLSVALFTFWQSTSFLPSQVQPTLQVGLDVQVQLATGNDLHAVTQVTVENSGDVRSVIIIGRLTTCHYVSEIDRAAQHGDCQKTIPLNDGSWIDKGTKLVHRETLLASTEKPLVELTYRFLYGRGDKLRLSTETTTATTAELGNSCVSGTFVGLRPDAGFKTLVEKSNALFYGETPAGVTRSLIGPADELNCSGSTGEDLAQYYGLTEATVIWTGWLIPPSPPTR